LEVAMRGEYHHLLEQDCLLLATLEAGKAVIGPSILNWLCAAALPEFNEAEKRWMRPDYPYLPIGALHLTNSFDKAPVIGEEMTWYDVYRRLKLVK
jgi:hypothetical protein